MYILISIFSENINGSRLCSLKMFAALRQIDKYDPDMKNGHCFKI